MLNSIALCHDDMVYVFVNERLCIVILVALPIITLLRKLTTFHWLPIVWVSTVLVERARRCGGDLVCARAVITFAHPSVWCDIFCEFLLLLSRCRLHIEEGAGVLRHVISSADRLAQACLQTSEKTALVSYFHSIVGVVMCFLFQRRRWCDEDVSGYV